MKKIIIDWLLKDIQDSYLRDYRYLAERIKEHQFLINHKPKFSVNEECYMLHKSELKKVTIDYLSHTYSDGSYYYNYRVKGEPFNELYRDERFLIKSKSIEDECSIKKQF